MKTLLKSFKRQKDPIKIGVVIFILCILLTIIFFVRNSSQRIQLTTQKSQKTYELITLTENGFSPSQLTIKKGMRVVWINNGNKDATVNSDPYPKNDKYPILQLGIFNVGQSLQTTFDIPGTYTYHNQFSPKQTGKIIVTN